MTIVDRAPIQLPTVLQPRDLYEAWSLKQELGEQSLYISGGTLLRTQWEAGSVSIPKYLIDLESIHPLKMISASTDELVVGSSAFLSQCLHQPLIRKMTPALHQALRSIAAPSIRNLATIGGNIASGVGDALPALLVYDTRLVWFDGKEEFEIPLSDWLKKKERIGSTNDILCKVRIQSPWGSREENQEALDVYHKVGRREAFIPSLITVALSGFIHKNESFNHIRVAVGGGNLTPKRLFSAEALLQKYSLQHLNPTELYEQVVREFEPYTDVFASASYKKKTVGNLVVAEVWKKIRKRHA